MSLIRLTKLQFGPRVMTGSTPSAREVIRSETILLHPDEISRIAPSSERDDVERMELGARIIMKEIHLKEFMRPASSYRVKETPDEIWDMIQTQKETGNERQ